MAAAAPPVHVLNGRATVEISNRAQNAMGLTHDDPSDPHIVHMPQDCTLVQFCIAVIIVTGNTHTTSATAEVRIAAEQTKGVIRTCLRRHHVHA